MAGEVVFYISDDGGVLVEVKRAGPQVRSEFDQLIAALRLSPTSSQLGVRVLKDQWPNRYTVRFDHATLVYSLTSDMPCIRLLLLMWDVVP